MRAAPVMMVMLPCLCSACQGSEGPCFVPSDQSAGWKRAALPDSASALAAPAGVEQFRSGEPAVVWDDREGRYAGTHHPYPGRSDYVFQVAQEDRVLEVEFTEPLSAARVDVVGYADGGRFPLLVSRRIQGTRVSIGWEDPPLPTLVVSVHSHLRAAPVVRRWRRGRWRVVTMEPGVGVDFQAPRSLYYLHPGGQRIELCQAKGEGLSVREASLHADPPQAVTLLPRR